MYLRYVILPFSLIYEYDMGTLARASVTEDCYSLAISLYIWELICVSIAYYWFNKKEKVCFRFEELDYDSESPTIYVVFIVFAGLIVLLVPSVFSQFHFVTSSFSELFSDSDESTIEKLSSYIVNVARLLLFVLVLYWISVRREHKKKGGLVGIIMLGLLLAIYYGSNRADYLLISIAGVVFYYRLFPKSNKMIAGFAFSFAAIVMILFSVARFTGANISTLVSRNIDSYFGGIPNVAIAVASKRAYQGEYTLLNFVFELFRPMLGVGMLLKNLSIFTSSEFFNSYIYGQGHVSQIIPMIGEGYFYFGFLFSPVLTIVFTKIGFLVQRSYYKTKSPILSFFVLVSALRLGWLCGQNAMIQLNDLTYNLLLVWILYRISIRIKRKKKDIIGNTPISYKGE